MGGLEKEAEMTKAKQQAAQPAQQTEAATPKGKIGAILALLSRPEGATLAQMQEATGWQAHSVRGAVAGTIKKKLGRTVTSEKVEGTRVYRIATEAAE
jgi:hypothetical protein